MRDFLPWSSPLIVVHGSPRGAKPARPNFELWPDLSLAAIRWEGGCPGHRAWLELWFPRCRSAVIAAVVSHSAPGDPLTIDGGAQTDRQAMAMSGKYGTRCSSILALLLAAGDAAAQPAEQFFARKTMTVTIGYTAGGSYDLYGRMVARHLGRHIPGQPTVIAQNMPGAGSLKAANYLYEVAPKDGTALGIIVEVGGARTGAGQSRPSSTTRQNSAISGASPPATTSSCSGIPPRCSRSTMPSASKRRWPAPARDRSPRPCRGCSMRSWAPNSSSSAAIPPPARRCSPWSAAKSRALLRPGRR